MKDGNPRCVEQNRRLQEVYAFLSNPIEWEQMSQQQRDAMKFHIRRANYALNRCESLTSQPQE